MKNTLLREMAGITPEFGHFALCHLGQHSFLLKLGDALLYLDPYLVPNPKRLIPPMIKADEASGALIVLGTHDHADHIDRPSWPLIAQASPGARFIVPEAVRPTITEVPAARLIGMNAGETVKIGGIRINAVPAAHELLDRDPKTGLYPYLGYVIEGNGVTIYHSGDCCLYEGIAAKLRQWKLDLALLPINGRDAWRFTHDIIGCMTYQEAADLAGAIRPKRVMPAHYDMFQANTEDPQKFLDYVHVKYPDLVTELPPTGKVAVY